MQKMKKLHEEEINRLKMQHMESTQALKEEIEIIKAQNVVYQDEIAHC